MRREINIRAGQRFSRLVAIRRLRSGHSQTWKCRCDCGMSVRVTASNLVRAIHPTKSCGCLQREATRLRNIRSSKLLPSGSRFGRLVVLRYLPRVPGKRSECECRCDCGRTVPIRDNRLKAGWTISCGRCQPANASAIAKKQEVARRFVFQGRRVSISDLAAASGLRRDTIERRLRRLGVASGRVPPSALAATEPRNARYLFLGVPLTTAQLAELSGLRRTAVAHRIRRAGAEPGAPLPPGFLAPRIPPSLLPSPTRRPRSPAGAHHRADP